MSGIISAEQFFEYFPANDPAVQGQQYASLMQATYTSIVRDATSPCAGAIMLTAFISMSLVVWLVQLALFSTATTSGAERWSLWVPVSVHWISSHAHAHLKFSHHDHWCCSPSIMCQGLQRSRAMVCRPRRYRRRKWHEHCYCKPFQAQVALKCF